MDVRGVCRELNLTTYVPFVVGTWSFPLASNDTTPSPCAPNRGNVSDGAPRLFSG